MYDCRNRVHTNVIAWNNSKILKVTIRYSIKDEMSTDRERKESVTPVINIARNWLSLKRMITVSLKWNIETRFNLISSKRRLFFFFPTRRKKIKWKHAGRIKWKLSKDSNSYEDYYVSYAISRFAFLWDTVSNGKRSNQSPTRASNRLSDSAAMELNNAWIISDSIPKTNYRKNCIERESHGLFINSSVISLCLLWHRLLHNRVYW